MDSAEIIPGQVIRDLVLKKLTFPVVFPSAVESWKCISWSLMDWAEKFSSAPLPFRVGYNEYIQEPCWERLCKTENLTLKEFVSWQQEQTARKTQGTNVTRKWMYFDYKYLHEWFNSNGDDVELVNWSYVGFPERGASESTLWIGSEGAHTPCHIDTYGCNLVAQIYGRKLWYLFPPDCTEVLQPTRVPYEESSIYSQINFFSPSPTLLQDGTFKNLSAYVVTLNPGDVLFVPHNWWHYVENTETAISINTWIELPDDDESRLKEAVVKLFVSSLCKELKSTQKEQLLNPNEDYVENTSTSTLLQYVDQSAKICTQKGNRKTKESSSRKKKCKYDPEGQISDPTVQPCFNKNEKAKTSGSSACFNSVGETLNMYKNLIVPVKKWPAADFEVLLLKKSEYFETCATLDCNVNMKTSPSSPTSSEHKDSSITSGDMRSDVNIVKRIINAVSSPDILAMLTEKILDSSD